MPGEREVHVEVKRRKVGSGSGRHGVSGDHSDELSEAREVSRDGSYIVIARILGQWNEELDRCR